MKITILYDNSSLDSYIRYGWGFSCLIDDRILFDTGESPGALFHNMHCLGLDAETIEAVVISHDHWDHTGGLWNLLEKRNGLTVYGCPGFGEDFKRRVSELKGRLIESAAFRKIDSRISLTGEVSGKYRGAVMPEQALMAKTESGIVVITGCSHPGIADMVARVKAVYPAEPVALVLGGFHLKDEGKEKIEAAASDLIRAGVLKVAPTHCTGQDAQSLFQDRFAGRYLSVCAGSRLEI
ncbi:MAG TPA: MBL fold metallo-hydrolase [bacterium]|nr:MBL fold metallo-hydrolase [bacterium]